MRFALCLTLLLLIGCGSTIERRWTSPEFDANAVVEDDLIVAGVVAVASLHQEGLANERSFTRALDGALAKHRPDLEPTPHERFIDLLPLDDIDLVLGRYRERGALSPESMEALTALGDEVRFAVFCRLEENRVERSAGDSSRPNLDSSGHTYSTGLKSKRTLVASFDVFDVTTGQLVWTAQFTKDDQRKRSTDYARREAGDDRKEPQFTWSGSGEFPEAPEFERMLESMFEDFARELPGR